MSELEGVISSGEMETISMGKKTMFMEAIIQWKEKETTEKALEIQSEEKITHSLGNKIQSGAKEIRFWGGEMELRGNKIWLKESRTMRKAEETMSMEKGIVSKESIMPLKAKIMVSKAGIMVFKDLITL